MSPPHPRRVPATPQPFPCQGPHHHLQVGTPEIFGGNMRFPCAAPWGIQDRHPHHLQAILVHPSLDGLGLISKTLASSVQMQARHSRPVASPQKDDSRSRRS